MQFLQRRSLPEKSTDLVLLFAYVQCVQTANKYGAVLALVAAHLVTSDKEYDFQLS